MSAKSPKRLPTRMEILRLNWQRAWARVDRASTALGAARNEAVAAGQALLKAEQGDPGPIKFKVEFGPLPSMKMRYPFSKMRKGDFLIVERQTFLPRGPASKLRSTVEYAHIAANRYAAIHGVKLRLLPQPDGSLRIEMV